MGSSARTNPTTFGMLRALQNAKLAGKIRFVGFDASDKLIQALTDGEIDGLVLQNPVNMGYLGVKTLVRHMRGEKVERRIDTGASLITRRNMMQPEMQERLHPDSRCWAAGEMAAPRLRMTGVRKAFGSTQALDGVTFAVEPARSTRSWERTARARAP